MKIVVRSVLYNILHTVTNNDDNSNNEDSNNNDNYDHVDGCDDDDSSDNNNEYGFIYIALFRVKHTQLDTIW